MAASRPIVMRERILAGAWNAQRNSFVGPSAVTNSMPPPCCWRKSASCPPDDPRFVATVAVQSAQNCVSAIYLYRYRHADDFGTPADRVHDLLLLVRQCPGVGGQDRTGARSTSRACWHGATTWTCCPRTWIRPPARLWGNYPQTYSMVGIINSACA